MTKLHLGCGCIYLEGYVNIDYPRTEHTVQEEALTADLYCDIATLDYPAGSVNEIRSHHVFEHFPRQTALALLCRWTDWLETGGVLRIETPDLMGAAKALTAWRTPYGKKQQIIRHLFGSHEANWAAHWDGWYEARFRHTLEALGYRDIHCVCSCWEALYNIDVTAIRGKAWFSFDDYEAMASKILGESLVTFREGELSESEKTMHSVWLDGWRKAYLLGRDSG